MEQKLTLSELNQWIKDALNTAIPGAVWLVAEISELKENRNGHCYLELVEKERADIVARARATIWSYTYRMLKPYFETSTGQSFSHGIKVLVQVSVEFHPAYGLSLNIKDIDPAYTVGDMALHRKEIIEQLKSDGVFNMNKELPLPLVPQRIAVISSKTAAGFQDFMDQLEKNSAGIKFYPRLFEAYMQGADAPSSIIAALERVFKYENFFDAVAIIRGGGAAADLSSFDNYDLAFNVTQFPLPVITGIGHEKDDTIIDLVAHTRLKTPTAVAEFFIQGAGVFYERLSEMEEEVVKLVRETIDTHREKLEDHAEKLQQVVNQFIDFKNRQLIKSGNVFQQKMNYFVFHRQVELNHLNHHLHSAVAVRKVQARNMIERQRRVIKQVTRQVFLREEAVLKQWKQHLNNGYDRIIAKEQERINRNQNAVRLLDPENVLNRGYTLTLKRGRILKSASSLKLDDEIETRFADGKVNSIITKKE